MAISVLDELRQIVASGANNISQPAVNRILLISMLQIQEQMTEAVKRLEYPSLLWLLRYKTKATLTGIAFVFVLLSILMTYTRPLLYWLAGVPQGILP